MIFHFGLLLLLPLVLAWNPWKWLGMAANLAVKQFRLTAGYSDGFGGTVPYTSTPLKPNNRVFTLGLTYDL